MRFTTGQVCYLFPACRKYLKGHGAIMVATKRKAATVVQTGKGKTGKAATVVQTGKGKAATVVQTGGLNAFGSRIGTMGDRLDQAFLTHPGKTWFMSPTTAGKENALTGFGSFTGFLETWYNHVNKLLRGGILEHGDNGRGFRYNPRTASKRLAGGKYGR